MHRFLRFLASAGLAALSSCGDSNSDSSQLVNITPTSPPPPPQIAAPVVPPHNYALKEGTTYSYIAAVSEDEKKAGKATGNVSMFKYLGKQGGLHVVASLNDQGQIVYLSRCADPCVIIKNDGGSRTAYNPNSIIGSVFEDAISGRLDADSQASRTGLVAGSGAAARVIPPRFRGEWNDDLNACGTDLSDARLVITASKLAFYESDALVERISATAPNTLDISARHSGEGQEWTSQIRLVLSRADNDLTTAMGGSVLTRHRCPT